MSLDDASASDIVDAPDDKPENKSKKRSPLSTRSPAHYIPFAMDMIAAAHYCSVGTTILYEAVRKKELKFRKLYGNGKSLFFRDDLEDWLRSHAVESAPIPKRRAAAPAGPE